MANTNRPKPLDTRFRCAFCQHGGTITVKLDKPNKTGKLDCSNCGQTYSCPITPLSEPVDVFTDWIDDCERVNKRQEEPSKKRRLQRAASEDDDEPPRQVQRTEDDDEDEDLPEAP